jgi:hypothetical protein
VLAKTVLKTLSCSLPLPPFGLCLSNDIVPIRCRCANGLYDVQLSDILKWLDFLGWPTSPDKLCDFHAVVHYIRFDWDFDSKLVSLPEEKHSKFLTQVTTWLDNAAHHRVHQQKVLMLLAAPEGWEHTRHFRSKVLLQRVLGVYTRPAQFFNPFHTIFFLVPLWKNSAISPKPNPPSRL